MRKRQIEPSHNEDERIVPAIYLSVEGDTIKGHGIIPPDVSKVAQTMGHAK